MIRAVVLGIIQGVTEFLPISSSGHLVLVEKLLGTEEPDIYMQVFLHLGTLVALVLVYKRRLGALFKSIGRALVRRMAERDPENMVYVACLAVGTVPAMLVGYFLRDVIEGFFAGGYEIGVFFILTGTVLFLTRFCREKNDRIGLADSLLVGLAQVAALLPGISRSGITMSAGMCRGLRKTDAAEFSFLLAVPAILMVSAYEILQAVKARPGSILYSFAGMCVAALVGYATVRWLLSLVRRGRLFSFSFYCWAVGLLSLVLWAFEGKGGF